MEDDRYERAREVMQSFEMGDEWLAAIDAGSPEWMVEWQQGLLDAYRTGNLEWVLEHSHPDIEIVQPSEFPDGRSYHGHEGVIEALLDWPREWEDFRLEPKRTFAVDDTRAIVVAVHRGRSLAMGIDVEAEIVWLFDIQGGLTRRWDMFMSVDAALSAAESS